MSNYNESEEAIRTKFRRVVILVGSEGENAISYELPRCSIFKMDSGYKIVVLLFFTKLKGFRYFYIGKICLIIRSIKNKEWQGREEMKIASISDWSLDRQECKAVNRVRGISQSSFPSPLHRAVIHLICQQPNCISSVVTVVLTWFNSGLDCEMILPTFHNTSYT
jgi:hypothetical protein